MGPRKTTSGDDLGNRRLPLQLGPHQIGWTNFVCLVLTVLSQAATILITWDVWQARNPAVTIINVPWFANPPQFDYAWLLLASLALALISPRNFGFAAHLLVLTIAIATDQLRLQPQIISVVVLMAACIFPSAKKLGVWFLIAMWAWAGIHKLLSPDWCGEVTYYLLLRVPSELETLRLWDYHGAFATTTAIAELGLGVLAWRRPKIAAPICFLSHIGIALFLIIVDWNFSVLPWNFCTAIVGAWLLWSGQKVAAPSPFPASTAGKIAVAVLLFSPIGFYFGMVRHSLCHVLYSANYPDAVITKAEGPETCEAIKTLRVPFPHEPKAFIDLFRLTGKPGEKLHIREFRDFMPSRFFEMSPQQTVVEISRGQFFNDNANTVTGIAFDDRRKLFQLEKEFHTANIGLEDGDPFLATILKRTAKDMIWAIKFAPDVNKTQSYELIDGLPNLEQIQFSGSNITNDELRCVRGLLRLTGIGLDDTAITDKGIKHLKGLPNLKTIQADRTEITQEAIDRTLVARPPGNHQR
jgi:hypothetical protein